MQSIAGEKGGVRLLLRDRFGNPRAPDEADGISVQLVRLAPRSIDATLAHGMRELALAEEAEAGAVEASGGEAAGGEMRGAPPTAGPRRADVLHGHVRRLPTAGGCDAPGYWLGFCAVLAAEYEGIVTLAEGGGWAAAAAAVAAQGGGSDSGSDSGGGSGGGGARAAGLAGPSAAVGPSASLRFRVSVRAAGVASGLCRLLPGTRLQGEVLQAGQWVSFVLQARDKFANPLRRPIGGATPRVRCGACQAELPPRVSDRGDGTYEVLLLPAAVGTHEVDVDVCGVRCDEDPPLPPRLASRLSSPVTSPLTPLPAPPPRRSGFKARPSASRWPQAARALRAARCAASSAASTPRRANASASKPATPSATPVTRGERSSAWW